MSDEAICLMLIGRRSSLNLCGERLAKVWKQI